MALPGRTDATEMAKLCRLTSGLDTSMAIDMANDITTEVPGSQLKTVEGVQVPFHDDHRLFLIETLLACHFYCLNDPRGARERVGPLTFEAQTRVDLGLNVTHFGQNALRLDTSGALGILNKAVNDGRIPVKFVCTAKWLGRSYRDWASWSSVVGTFGGIN